MMRWVPLFVLLVGVAFSTVGTTVASGQPPGKPLRCADCHDQPARIAGTAHAAISCLACHPKHTQVPHPGGIAKPSCASCHREVAARFRHSVHGEARGKGDTDAPGCGDCHGDVHEVKNTGTEAFRRSIPTICGQCHDQVYDQYRESVHGEAVRRGIVAAPVCSDCHGEHTIQPPEVSGSSVSPSHIPATCGRCHGDVALTERFNLPQISVVSFQASVHGLALKAGTPTVANCASCHGVHDILPSSDPRSSINPKNLPKTCGKCHPGAGTRFAIGRVHWVPGGGEPTSVRWVRLAYWILIPLVIGLMCLHNFGDWLRKLLRTRLAVPAAEDTSRPPGESVRYAPPPPAEFRMYREERLQHGALVLSFLLLVWTGFALKYPEQWWARPLVAWEHGWPVRAILHRIAGTVLIALSVVHVVSLVASRRLRSHWKSLRPGIADVGEASGMFLYNLGLRRHRPSVSSHSYVEKAEYWAVVWGSAVMAITGTMLWANTFVLVHFPKVVLDIAVAIHFYEAVLASLAILVWHFYSVIFDPDVYPMDPAWYTGYSVRRRETEERPPAEDK